MRDLARGYAYVLPARGSVQCTMKTFEAMNIIFLSEANTFDRHFTSPCSRLHKTAEGFTNELPRCTPLR